MTKLGKVSEQTKSPKTAGIKEPFAPFQPYTI